MSELRHDPIQRRWVIIASERARRPSDFRVTTDDTKTDFCPLCEGNEDKTPPEVFAFRDGGTKPNSPGWAVRVVPNKFPALRIEGELKRKGLGIYDMMNGIGAHEVVIEAPGHDLHLADMPHEHLGKVIQVYRQRLCDLKRDPRFRYILIFKNYGLAAGASLSHPHTQLIATPVTPLAVAHELDSAKEHYREKERCLFCDVIEQEIASGDRIIVERENFIAIAPFASRFPFEVFLAPKNHSHDFSEISDPDVASLARTLKNVLLRLKMNLQDPPYNFVLHTAPNTETTPKRYGYWWTLAFDYHWHIEIIPRLTRVAGFEWGTDFYINPMPPEDAAKYLRETEI